VALLITYGALALFFAVVVLILQRSYVADRNFTDFAVAGRSFGGFFQAMAFFNTYQPGFVFLGSFGFIVKTGVVGMGISTLLAPVVMYLMADRVWTWGAKYDLRTQPDLMALRYDSKHVRLVAALVGIFGLFPWMVLGMQSLGAVFFALSLGHLSFTASVVLGVVVMTIRQIWTIRMGMRGIVISDLFQGVVAYLFGSALTIGLIVWLYAGGASLAALPAERFQIPGPETDSSLLFLSLTLLPLLCSLCWPDLFVRLYTGSGVASVKRSSAYCAPIALVFVSSLGFLALLASGRPDVAANPDAAWFTLALAAGGPLLLAMAGVVVFAASMGNIDATVQSIGAQIANDVIGAVRPDREAMNERGLMLTSQISMAAITLLSATIACLPLPALFTIALFAFQIMVQLSVPLYFGIFSKFGNQHGAAGGMLAGIATVCALQLAWPIGVPWAFGLTTGALGLAVNLIVFIAAGFLIRRTEDEQARLDALFENVGSPRRSSARNNSAPQLVRKLNLVEDMNLKDMPDAVGCWLDRVARDQLIAWPRRGPLLHWLIFTGATIFAFVLLWHYGLIRQMIVSDRTHISSLIILLYIGASLHCLWRTVAISREDDAARQAAELVATDGRHLTFDDRGPTAEPMLPNGLVTSHIRNLATKARTQGSTRLDQTLLLRGLAGQLRGSNHFGSFASDTLMKLGLLGTIVGFIMMLAPIAGLDADNRGALKSSMTMMSDGMAVAMYTTLAGLVGSILIKIQYYMLDDATSRLFNFAVGMTEVHVVSALERQSATNR
jgi:solute:Na+ symporter, SSS family